MFFAQQTIFRAETDINVIRKPRSSQNSGFTRAHCARKARPVEASRARRIWRELLRNIARPLPFHWTPQETGRMLLKIKKIRQYMSKIYFAIRAPRTKFTPPFPTRSSTIKNKKCKNSLALRISCGRLAPFSAPLIQIPGIVSASIGRSGRDSTREVGYMGLVFLVVIWLITFVSTYFFIAKTWWLPVGASAAAAGIDHHFATTYILDGHCVRGRPGRAGLLCVEISRSRVTAPPARYSHGNNTLEIVWTVLTADTVCRAEFDEQLDLGLRTFPPGRLRRHTGRSHRHAVRLVFPLSRARWQIRWDQAGIHRSFRGRRERRSASTPPTRPPKMTSSPEPCMCR